MLSLSTLIDEPSSSLVATVTQFSASAWLASSAIGTAMSIFQIFMTPSVRFCNGPLCQGTSGRTNRRQLDTRAHYRCASGPRELPESPKLQKESRAGEQQDDQECRDTQGEMTIGPGGHAQAAASFLSFGGVALGALHQLKPVARPNCF